MLDKNILSNKGIYFVSQWKTGSGACCGWSYYIDSQEAEKER